MITDVIDTATRIGWTLAAWIAVLAAAATIILLTAAATGAWAWRWARRAVTAPSWAHGRVRARILARAAVRRSQGRTADPDYQEAA